MSRAFAGGIGWGLTLVFMVVLGYHPQDVAAEAVGSPASILEKGQWVMGLGGGVLLGKGFKGGADATGYQLGHFRGYGLTDRLSIYGKIGGAGLSIEDSSIVKQDKSTTHNFLGVLGGIALKGKLWESPRKTWEVDGSLHYAIMRARHRHGNDGRWQEWVFATSAARSFGRVKPYVGVKYSLASMKFKVRESGSLLQQGTYKSDVRVGPFLGTDVYFGQAEDVIVNVETSYLDGTEVHLAIQYIF